MNVLTGYDVFGMKPTDHVGVDKQPTCDPAQTPGNSFSTN